MQLYIVRHGIAIDREDPKCPPDPQRYLTEEGVEKTKQVAKGVAALGVTADLFLTSPYVRAAQRRARRHNGGEGQRIRLAGQGSSGKG